MFIFLIILYCILFVILISYLYSCNFSYLAKIASPNEEFMIFPEAETLFGNIGGVLHICKTVTARLVEFYLFLDRAPPSSPWISYMILIK